eukprot:364552-Chlamydomonas_euryale.AAC.9
MRTGRIPKACLPNLKIPTECRVRILPRCLTKCCAAKGAAVTTGLAKSCVLPDAPGWACAIGSFTERGAQPESGVRVRVRESASPLNVER